jgi:hypothetical protein
MKLTLSQAEKFELLTTSLQYFTESLQVWEHLVYVDGKEYNKAKLKLIKNTKSTCIEDIWAQMILHGKGITIIDEQDQDSRIQFDKNLFNKNLSNCNPSEIIKVLDDSGDYDFYTLDTILQSLIFGEAIYG